MTGFDTVARGAGAVIETLLDEDAVLPSARRGAMRSTPPRAPIRHAWVAGAGDRRRHT
jgi:hypothetical protein